MLKRGGILHLGLFLMLVCLASAAALTLTYELTSPLIEEQRLQARADALRAVVPDADDFEDITDTIENLDDFPDVDLVYEGYGGGDLVGYAILVSPMGYEAKIEMAVGFTDGEIQGIRIMNQTETPGLGARITEEDFREQYAGLSADEEIALARHNGQIDSLAGATASAEAVTRGVERARRLYQHLTDPEAADALGEAEEAALTSLFPDLDVENMVREPVEDVEGLRAIHMINPDDLGEGTGLTVSVSGYAGPVVMVVGFKGDEIVGYRLVDHSESPGIGTRVEEDEFKDRFVGLSVTESVALTKDGGQIDALSGATVTSSAVTEGVELARDYYSEEIRGDG